MAQALRSVGTFRLTTEQWVIHMAEQNPLHSEPIDRRMSHASQMAASTPSIHWSITRSSFVSTLSTNVASPAHLSSQFALPMQHQRPHLGAKQLALRWCTTTL
ncbi:hypothetical protein SCLCIDRAFT_1222862 [Scleroderma citrinum Foug A]|uniref:Uncharacterized protein n=1 Tax=Scleroderma citrinum Foug A TaxID=1036808 RepID=A0A0C3DAA8_9AGAM|nr:hypothetical protein SCLCIDRAFT_1222862 [Scleroderma citrinum Foug A]